MKASNVARTGATIFPTHTCFDDSLDFIAENLRLKPELLHEFTLAHGICLAPDGPKKGEAFAHAWVEQGPEVWQSGILNGEKIFYSMARAEFEEALKVQSVTRYTVREAAEQNRIHGTYGPWERRYKTLCNDGGKPEVFE